MLFLMKNILIWIGISKTAWYRRTYTCIFYLVTNFCCCCWDKCIHIFLLHIFWQIYPHITWSIYPYICMFFLWLIYTDIWIYFFKTKNMPIFVCCFVWQIYPHIWMLFLVTNTFTHLYIILFEKYNHIFPWYFLWQLYSHICIFFTVAHLSLY